MFVVRWHKSASRPSPSPNLSPSRLQTVLHTEFYRQRAQPGQVVVGADSHSCSTGGLGAFAIGLGAADVVMPLVTGETWIKVPETVKVEFTGTPPFGIVGKDVMLYTLRQLKCNTVSTVML